MLDMDNAAAHKPFVAGPTLIQVTLLATRFKLCPEHLSFGKWELHPMTFLLENEGSVSQPRSLKEMIAVATKQLLLQHGRMSSQQWNSVSQLTDYCPRARSLATRGMGCIQAHMLLGLLLSKHLDILHAQRADLVLLQPLVHATTVETMLTWQSPQRIMSLKVAKTDGATCLGTGIGELLKRDGVNKCLRSTAWFRLCRGLRVWLERVIEDNQGHEQPCNSLEHDCHAQLIKTWTRPAVSGVQQPNNAQDKPTVGCDRGHLTHTPGSRFGELTKPFLEIPVGLLSLAHAKVESDTHR